MFERIKSALRESFSGPAGWVMAVYWPIYAICYTLICHAEGLKRYPIQCAFDERIPLLTGFSIPYLLWFPFWIGVLIYAALREPKVFRRTMGFFMLTFTVAVTIFGVLPTCFPLRPETVPGSDLCAWITRFIYWIDANNNVCPSEHVIGAVGAVFAVFALEKPRASRAVRIAATLMAALIILSILFVRQHSILDIFAAVPLILLGWWLCFRLPKSREKAREARR